MYVDFYSKLRMYVDFYIFRKVVVMMMINEIMKQKKEACYVGTNDLEVLHECEIG
jgi:hypothetical protein